mgnify:CR=1 FL=1
MKKFKVYEILSYVLIALSLILVGADFATGRWVIAISLLCIAACLYSIVNLSKKINLHHDIEKMTKEVTASIGKIINDSGSEIAPISEETATELQKTLDSIQKSITEPHCSAENNDQINFHNIAEEVGSDD